MVSFLPFFGKRAPRKTIKSTIFAPLKKITRSATALQS